MVVRPIDLWVPDHARSDLAHGQAGPLPGASRWPVPRHRKPEATNPRGFEAIVAKQHRLNLPDAIIHLNLAKDSLLAIRNSRSPDRPP
jgi:hypothetical protein